MTIDIKTKKPAKRYSKALFECIENSDFNKILFEIETFLNLFENNFELKNFLTHPLVSNNDKKEAVKEICKNFSEITINFLSLLIDEKRLNCLYEIKNSLIEKINEKNNLTEVEITLAIEAGEELKNKIKERLKNKLNSDILAEFKKDEAILGGMLIKINDTLIDLSVKNKMEKFKQK